MKSLKQHVADQIRQSLDKLYPGIDVDVEASLDYADPQFGDVASNLALQMAKQVGKSPMEIAESLASELQGVEGIEQAAAAAPGFLNLTLSPAVLSSQLAQISTDFERFTRSELPELANQTMLIDYSHPNIGKPMGVHHLLSTIIGDSIKRTYLVAGTTVIADNFVGDLGTQFGKLIHAIKTWGDMEAIEHDPITELQKLYVRFHIEADGDDTLDEAGRAEYRKLEAGDAENRELWQRIIMWSLAEIQPIYDALGVTFDHMNGESFYEDKLAGIIDLGLKNGVFTESDGALIAELDNPDEPPAVIRKRDGASLYITRDLARIEYWEHTWHPDLMVNVVDVAQSLQFRQLYEVASKLGLTNARNIHVAFGRMKFPDGAMSTRRGNVLLLQDLIAEARRRARDQVVSKSKELSSQQADELTERIAIGAIKYNILHQNRNSDMTFDWDTMLAFEGNSAPYLMYTVIRAQSVANKAGQAKRQVNSGEFSQVERKLALLLSQYPQCLAEATRDFKPNLICNYLYELASCYNSFYHSSPILGGGEAQASRLLINQLTITVMSHGLDLLGIELPSKM